MPEKFVADDDVAYSARVRTGVAILGGGYFLSREIRETGKDLGLSPWPGYFIGRCGVLGAAKPDVVAAILGFFPIGFVHNAWLQALEADLDQAVEANLVGLGTWSERKLGDFEGVERLADLAESVVRESSPVGSPLFAGWRNVPLAKEPPLRAVQSLLALRELRGAFHLSAVLASGISPLEAIIAGSGGPENARFFGWEDLTIDPEREEIVSKARGEAERRTDRMAAQSWMHLGLEDRVDFATLLDDALNHVTGS